MTLLRSLAVLLLLSVAACGYPYPASDGSDPAFFPHDEDWRLGGHWEDGRNNTLTCLICHDEYAEEDVDYRGGEAPPPCNGCHSWPLNDRPGGDAS